jgi:DNA-binding ferritin-like protein
MRQSCPPSDPTAQTLQNLLGALRAAHWSHWTSHWQVAGGSYYGDHLLLQRLYEAIPAEIDALAEKLVGAYGPDVVEPVCQAHVMLEFLNLQADTDPIRRARKVEEHLLGYFQDVFSGLEASRALSLGMNDFLAATANAHETFVYLLRQRTR